MTRFPSSFLKNLPIFERAFEQVRVIHRNANEHYAASMYPGRIAIFFSVVNDHHDPNPNYKKRWKKLARGGLDYHNILGNHESILKGPDVKGLTDLKEIPNPSDSR